MLSPAISIIKATKQIKWHKKTENDRWIIIKVSALVLVSISTGMIFF